MNRIVVTGATGYIGNRLMMLAQKEGVQILATVRQPEGKPDVPSFDFGAPTVSAMPADVTAVLHLAADTTIQSGEGADAEVLAAELLMAEAHKVGALFVFVSSQAAHEYAPSPYGKTKWRIERIVLKAGGCVVRPGMVYGGPVKGLFGTLVSVTRRLPFYPAFLPAPQVQPIHVDDLARALLQLAHRPDLGGRVMCLGDPEPVSFSSFMAAIARIRVRRFIVPFPIPTSLLRLAAKAVGPRLAQSTGLNRLQSLFELPPMKTAADLVALQIALRSMNRGMHVSGDGSRRVLLEEAAVLARYVSGVRCSPFLLRRYVWAIMLLCGGRALGLNGVFRAFPAGFALLDSLFLKRTQFPAMAWRVDAMTRIVEASPLGAKRLLGIGRSESAARAGLDIAAAITREIFWSVLRLALHPCLKGYAVRLERRIAS